MSQLLKKLAMSGGKHHKGGSKHVQKHVGGEEPLEKMSGGLGAATYATSVYGDAGSQHAGANGAIAMTSPIAPITGGRKQKKRSQKRRSQKKRSQKRRSSRR